MSGDIRTGIAGTGGAGYDIYTKFPPGSSQPGPPGDNGILLEDNTSFFLLEDGTSFILLES